MAERFAGKLEMLRGYDVPDDVEKTRYMTFLDASRDENCIDDVLVFLIKDELKMEGCWVRIIGLGDHWFIGILLNEPNQDFGYHAGDKITFFVQETEDKQVVCYSDLNLCFNLTAEDLKDGSLLEAAVTTYHKEPTELHLMNVLEILRDSVVWIPCNVVLGDEDGKNWNKVAEKLMNHPDSDLIELTGKEYQTKGDIRFIPDILKNGDKYYFPIFSTAEAMGEYGNHFSKVQNHMLDVIPLARNNEKKPVGIVLNAFTEPFEIDEKIWNLIENMKSRIIE